MTRNLRLRFKAECRLLKLKNADVTDRRDRREHRKINNARETDIKGRAKFNQCRSSK
ncbi:hypothetical protein [Chamaesiphon minutus]|uniref:hypothetical protein n=1 Tax=Chamaesiphon minutus TaxID=1173032 RepID=UPI0012F83FD7|nr:hypothetical protein [Chamaesiphon minutus]